MLDPLDGLNSFANQSLMNVVDRFEKSLQLQTLALAHTSASTKEHYISSAKTYDGIDYKKFNEWLEGVHRLSKVTGKAPLDVAASTKEHYISSAKTYDGIDYKKFNEWLEGVHRLPKVTGKAPLDVAVATSSGSLHKYICELIGKIET